MKFTQLLLCAILIISNSLNAIVNPNIRLTSELLATMDGVPKIGIDVDLIRKTMDMGKKLAEIQFGKLDKATKKRIPQYSFQGKFYTLQQLVSIEKEFEKKYAGQPNTNPQKAKVAEALKKTLLMAKKDFKVAIKKYLEETRSGGKHQEKFTKEFCDKAGRPNSQLNNWKEGSELSSFKDNVTSFKIYYTFCTDLSDFFAVFIRSCPKALKQYQDWAKQFKSPCAGSICDVSDSVTAA